MFFPECCIGHLLKHSEHGPIVHVVSVDHGVPAFRGAVPLKENAAGCAPFPFIGAPQVVFGVLGAALQNRVVHTGSGYGDPPLDIRVFRLQGPGGLQWLPAPVPGRFVHSQPVPPRSFRLRGGGCTVYSSFRACASPLVSPGWSTKNHASPNRLRHSRPLQKPFRKGFHRISWSLPWPPADLFFLPTRCMARSPPPASSARAERPIKNCGHPGAVPSLRNGGNFRHQLVVHRHGDGFASQDLHGLVIRQDILFSILTGHLGYGVFAHPEGDVDLTVLIGLELLLIGVAHEVGAR